MYISYLISGFCADGLFGTRSGNLKRIAYILPTKYFSKWLESDITDVKQAVAFYEGYYL